MFRLTATDKAGNTAGDDFTFTWNVVGPPAPAVQLQHLKHLLDLQKKVFQ